ncbi:MAG TPA: hypothetical protein VD948_01490 [Rhodothermales bacterium]|nr:hypothetical protein [Rhodothermales bacterium]
MSDVVLRLTQYQALKAVRAASQSLLLWLDRSDIPWADMDPMVFDEAETLRQALANDALPKDGRSA